MITQIQREKLTQFAQALVNQERAQIIVPANEPLSGFWFGGGNMVEGSDGTLYLVGRYRNHGDSRTGLKLGQRGLEMVVFQSQDKGKTFTKMFSLTKADLSVGKRTVLSIEGTALRFTDNGVELSWKSPANARPSQIEFRSIGATSSVRITVPSMEQ